MISLKKEALATGVHGLRRVKMFAQFVLLPAIFPAWIAAAHRYESVVYTIVPHTKCGAMLQFPGQSATYFCE